MAEAPLKSRIMAAHLLAGLLWAQAAAAAAGVAITFLDENYRVLLLYAGLAIFALTAGVLEWRRNVRGEALAFVAFVLGVLLSLLALPYGLWYYVPFLGVTTLGVMIALMYRMAVRSEARHSPEARHA